MSTTTKNISLPEIQSWLETVLGPAEVPDWEVTPETVAKLSSLYSLNTFLEKQSSVEINLLEQKSAEYLAEASRLQGMISSVGQGVEEGLNQGPAQAYCEVLSGLCSSLDLDSSHSVGLESAISELLVKQAESGPEIAKTSREIEVRKSDTVVMYERLSKLDDIVKSVKKTVREEESIAKDNSRKMEHRKAKAKEYRRTLERQEGVLVRNGAHDFTIRHEEIVKLNSRLVELEEKIGPLKSQLKGFLSLPPSNELARVELVKCKEELEQLESEISVEISFSSLI